MKTIVDTATGKSTNALSGYEDKLVMTSKHDQFPDIPKETSLENLTEWRYLISSTLKSPPWSIDGESILQMKDIDEPSVGYKLRTNILCKHLLEKVRKADLSSIMKQFESITEKGHGVDFFVALFDVLLPHTTNKI